MEKSNKLELQKKYETPENIFVGGFIGSPTMNFFRGKLTETDFVIDNTIKIKVSEGKMKMLREQGYVNKEIVLGIRPEDIHDELLFLEASDLLPSQQKLKSLSY